MSEQLSEAIERADNCYEDCASIDIGGIGIVERAHLRYERATLAELHAIRVALTDTSENEDA